MFGRRWTISFAWDRQRKRAAWKQIPLFLLVIGHWPPLSWRLTAYQEGLIWTCYRHVCNSLKLGCQVLFISPFECTCTYTLYFKKKLYGSDGKSTGWGFEHMITCYMDNYHLGDWDHRAACSTYPDLSSRLPFVCVNYEHIICFHF